MNVVFQVLFVASSIGVVAGCGHVNQSFACKKTAHDTCLSVPQAYHLSQKAHAPLPKVSQPTQTPRVSIWVAPYQDQQGIGHSAHWLTYPVTD